MKPLHLASYAANVAAIGVFTYLLITRPDTPKPAITSSRPAIGKTSSTTSTPKLDAPPPVLRLPSVNWADNNVRAVIAELRRLGAPPDVVADVTRLLLRRKYTDLELAILYPPGAPKWMQNRKHYISPEVTEKLRALRQASRDELRALIGDDADETTINKQWLATMPAGLSEETKNKVGELIYDYQQARQSAGRILSPASQDAIDARFHADLAKILSPQELHDYDAYNSSAANRLQMLLADLDISDATYLQLYDAMIISRQKSGADTRSLRSAQLDPGEFEVLRGITGDELAVSIALRQDAKLQQIAAIAFSEADSASARVGKCQAWLKFMSDITTGSLAQAPARQSAAAAEAYAKLTNGLSASARQQFDTSPPGVFIRHFMGAR